MVFRLFLPESTISCLSLYCKNSKFIMATKVTFTLPAEVVADATEGLLLGEFNNWDQANGIALKKQKDGSLKATTSLEAGKTYQYRYLLNDGRWVNDQQAETFVYAEGFAVENCVITVPAAAPKAPRVKKETVKKAEPKVAVADDLTKIEGIGKKINQLLAAENIVSYKELSKLSVKKLNAILEAAGNKFSMHDPTSWPKQAKLAAAGKWDELATLQKELVAGK
jgi:predicted flap endonuclease-1-like 5' DNA nuclease